MNGRNIPDIMSYTQSLNLYTYCMNNPVMFSDPGGESITIATLILIFSIAAATTAASYTAYKSHKYTGKIDWQNVITSGISWFMLTYSFGMTGYGLYLDYCNYTGRTPVTEIKFNAQVSANRSAGNFGNLSRAGEYGIKPYSEMTKTLKGSGLQAHHIVEQRFGLNISQSVAVTTAEHQAFTNAWRNLIPYGTNYSTLTNAQIWSAAQKVYAGYPTILDAIQKALFGG